MEFRNKPIIEAMQNTSLIEVKAGKERTRFTEIWIVNVGERLFARSWNLSEESWYTAFETEGKGELKIGEQIFKVKGFKPSDILSMHPRINNAYLLRYDEGENSFYARGIIQPKYYERTMEFELAD